MRRTWILVGALGLLAFAWPGLARAQQAYPLLDPHPERHEILALGFQGRFGQLVGDNVRDGFGVSIEVGGVLDLRYGDRSHWHLRLVAFAGLGSERFDFSRTQSPWRFGARLFPIAVGFGSDLVAMRLGAELGVTEITRSFGGMIDPQTGPEVHFGPSAEVAFEVVDGVEIIVYGAMPIFPIVHGEYGLSAAWLFF